MYLLVVCATEIRLAVKFLDKLFSLGRELRENVCVGADELMQDCRVASPDPELHLSGVFDTGHVRHENVVADILELPIHLHVDFDIVGMEGLEDIDFLESDFCHDITSLLIGLMIQI